MILVTKHIMNLLKIFMRIRNDSFFLYNNINIRYYTLSKGVVCVGYERRKKDANKYIIASHHAFIRTFNTLNYYEPETYSIYYNRTSYSDEIMQDYEKVYRLFKEVHPNKIVNIFDKAICFGMVLRKYDSFGCIRKNSAPKRIALINERFIAEFMLSILHYSSYSLRAPGNGNGELISSTPFDLDTLFADHKELLDEKIRRIMILLAEDEYKANEIKELLIEIYHLAILYGNCIEENDFEKARKRIRIKETKTAYSLVSEESDTLKWHREDLIKTIIR